MPRTAAFFVSLFSKSQVATLKLTILRPLLLSGSAQCVPGASACEALFEGLAKDVLFFHNWFVCFVLHVPAYCQVGLDLADDAGELKMLLFDRNLKPLQKLGKIASQSAD